MYKFINFADIKDKLPIRGNFCTEDDITSEDLVFFPNDVYDKEDYGNNQSGNKSNYHIYMFGSLRGGDKVLVILNNIDIFFDVLVPDKFQADPEKYIYSLKALMKPVYFKKAEVIEAYWMGGFQKYPSKFLRLYFDSTYNRKKAIDICAGTLDLKTGSDDSLYLNKIIRDYKFNSCDWNIIKNGSFEIVDGNNKRTGDPTCKYVIKASINDIKPYSDMITMPDKTMVMAWDIETYTFKDQTGDAPKAGDKNYEIFCICATFHWHYSIDALVKFCCVKGITNDDPNIFADESKADCNVIVKCKDEREVLLSFAEIYHKMQPDITVAFNSGNFDWPIVRARFEEIITGSEDIDGNPIENGLLFMKSKFSVIPPAKNERIDTTRRCFSNEVVKISAEDPAFETISAQFDGSVDTDAMIVFKQRHPSVEVGRQFSLNFYLKMNNLLGKNDMPYKRLFAICKVNNEFAKINTNKFISVLDFEPTEDRIDTEYIPFINTIIADMEAGRVDEDKIQRCDALIRWMVGLVVSYCLVDSFKCHQLYYVCKIINEKRLLSNMAYMNLYSSFYRANGVKVRNLIGSYCDEFNMVFSNRPVNNPDLTYEGAIVFPPIRGLEVDYPVASLDASSLYPSIEMAYNISIDMAVEYNGEDSVRYVKQLMDEGYTLQFVKFNVWNKSTPNNKSKVRGWFVRHNSVFKSGDNAILPDGTTRPALPGERMGIIPYILKKLFDKRAIIKQKLNAFKSIKEKLAKNNNDTRVLNQSDVNNTGYTLEQVVAMSISDIYLIYDRINSTQLALKVFMNTFYGEQGNRRSPIYKLLVGGGITSEGRNTIKKVKQFLTERNYVVRYGDTDSNYIMCPEHYFDDIKTIYDGVNNTIDNIIANMK